ncbi:hypothetical protein ATHSA_1231 [Athalassotoga saccharophila]|nr:hypothetical protein ATHSA_1231 [Athalassotoga saccharophila]
MNIFIFSNMTFTKFIGGVETVLLNFDKDLKNTNHKLYFIGLVYDEAELV